ncbi:MAG: filamentous hemagglutinin N-terminal domain-containing protein [Synechococcaceae cyanobacterium RL_1_2]|nr:filamentous hemagglutinin N-terminal domain-containing protein [Synechococcaceae cyanobacterium RL_1_2]
MAKLSVYLSVYLKSYRFPLAMAFGFLPSTLTAQILPDNTLGLTPSVVNNHGSEFLIDGGAARGNNLFHSFEDFNVNAGDAVYFLNPSTIDNIFSRVTGDRSSSINGTLGVDGPANLYLINPHGFLFGESAQLDLEGSFAATTADAIAFDRFAFSATNPTPPPLLDVAVPLGLQFGSSNIGKISNLGNLTLAADQALGFFTDRIDDGGQITAGAIQLFALDQVNLSSSKLYAADNLSILAGNKVQVRDSESDNFQAIAGGNLHIQGNESIDILALNHPQIPFQSGGNLTLVSDGTISGDAHFSSKGNFSILDLSGNPGTFVSLYDPIISSERDVTIGDYTGASLKVESKGNITTGNIVIASADTSLTASNDPDVQILRESPSLILRAGVDELLHPVTPDNPNPSFPNIPRPTFTSSTDVYTNDFEGIVGNEWSNISTDQTPIGDRGFLGQFTNNVINLSLDNLPDHQLATVSFDLFILKSWDGNASESSDIWGLSFDGGFPLLVTTFSNQDQSFGPGEKFQSFPNQFNPFSPNNTNEPAFTGAGEINTLGFVYNYRTVGERVSDSVYNLTFTFPHNDQSLGLNLLGLQLSDASDESWGLDNFKVSVQEAVTSSGDPYPAIELPLPAITTTNQTSLGSVNSGFILTLGGPVIMASQDDIILNGPINTSGGDIQINTPKNVYVNASMSSTGGDISIKTGENIFNGTNHPVEVSGRLDGARGGDITFHADGDIDGNFKIISGGESSFISGGNIDLTENGEINFRGKDLGFPINVIAAENIVIGKLDSRGADINLTAGNDIRTIGIITSTNFQAGDF